MKYSFFIKIYDSIPKPYWEGLMFFGAVLFGSIVKIFRQKEAGVKMTFSKMAAEALMSFFIAGVVYAVFDQFLEFNKLFTYAMCSLAGSMSHKITRGLESVIDTGFDKAKSKINNL